MSLPEKSQSRSLTCALLLVASMISACGGGGGGNSDKNFLQTPPVNLPPVPPNGGQTVLPEETDFCANSTVAMAQLASNALAETERVDQIVIKLLPSSNGGGDTNNASRIAEVINRAFDVLTRGDSVHKALFSVPGMRQSVRLLRPMSGGAAVISLGRQWTIEQGDRFSAVLNEDPAVDYAAPDETVEAAALDTSLQQMVISNIQDKNWHVKRIRAEDALALLTQIDRNQIITGIVDSGWTDHSSLRDSYIDEGVNLTIYGDWNEHIKNTARELFNGQSDADGNLFRRAFWHGTAVAGFVSAKSSRDLNLEITGVDPGAPILHANVANLLNKTLHTSDVADGMRWTAGLGVPNYQAPTNAAKIINVSIATSLSTVTNRQPHACSKIYQEAINEVLAKDVTIVTAAGNSNAPASWSQPGNCEGVINVGGTNSVDQRYGWMGLSPFSGSNYGRAVTISAPGENVWVIQLNSDIERLGDSQIQAYVPQDGSETEVQETGTSFSAPQVAGVVSLMLAANPGLKPAQIKQILTETAEPARVTQTQCSRPAGAGIVNAEAAVRRALQTRGR